MRRAINAGIVYVPEFEGAFKKNVVWSVTVSWEDQRTPAVVDSHIYDYWLELQATGAAGNSIAPYVDEDRMSAIEEMLEDQDNWGRANDDGWYYDDNEEEKEDSHEDGADE